MLKNLYTKELLEALEHWDGSYGPPSKFARKSPNGIRIFKNPFIEYVLGRAHPIIPGLWVIPLSTYCMWKALQITSPVLVLWIFLAGIFMWSLLEYVLHTLLFHFASKSDCFESKVRQFMLHGYHHEYPNDPMRLVAPPLMAWPLGTLVGIGVRLLLGPNFFWSFFPGVIMGYLAYDWIHFYTHHSKPGNGIGKFLRDYHLIHHYAHHTNNMGISSPLWDMAFGLSKFPRKMPKRTALEIDRNI